MDETTGQLLRANKGRAAARELALSDEAGAGRIYDGVMGIPGYCAGLRRRRRPTVGRMRFPAGVPMQEFARRRLSRRYSARTGA